VTAGNGTTAGSLALGCYQAGIIRTLNVDGVGIHFGVNGTDQWTLDASGNVTGNGNLQAGANQATGTTLTLGNAGGVGNLGNILFGDTNHQITVNANILTFETFGGHFQWTDTNAGAIQADLNAGVFALIEVTVAPGAAVGYGRLYVFTDGSLHYVTPGGNNRTLAAGP
jgi:hypothetical protein